MFLIFFFTLRSCHRDVALAIIQDENWELALKNKILGEDGRATTPMRKLIVRLPGKSFLTITEANFFKDS